MTYSERVILVGAPTPLSGVFTIPESTPTKSPALILLNSGLMHRVGTCNLSVKLARSAAKVGIPAVRFDFSGIGDSRKRAFAGSHKAREVSEVREMMDELSRQEDITQFMLCGLCSGADAALAIAAVDPRVVGIVQLDPLCFRTPKWYFYHYYPRILDINRWFRLFKRLSGMQESSEVLPADYLLEKDELPEYDFDQKSITTNYAEIVNRGVRTLVVMTSAQDYCYNSLGQFRDSFGSVNFGSTLEEYFLPETQHIFAEPEDQKFIVDLVSRWAASI